MDELEEHRELDRLIAEQEADDTLSILHDEAGHRDDITVEGLDNILAQDENGELVTFFPRERATVLVGGASHHGTLAGYTKHGCRKPCCKDVWNAYMRDYRARKKQEAAS